MLIIVFISDKLQPLGTNQQHFSYNTNNKNNNNISNNNNENFIIENQTPQGLRIHNIQQAQQHANLQQKYHNCMNLSNSSAVLNTQIICTKQNLRNIQLHQKPISSVAPSFPVKSPIYKTSSTKIHPVMPQTLNLLSRGHTGYNTLKNQNQSNDNVQNVTQELNSVMKSNPPSASAATISLSEQSNEKPLSKLEVQVRIEQNGLKYENSATLNKYEPSIQQTKGFDSSGKEDGKREPPAKCETVKADLNAKFDLKADQLLLKNDLVDAVKYDKSQNTFDNSALYDHNVELIHADAKLSEMVSDQEKFKPDVERKIFLYNEMKNEDKPKPTLPPKPTKSNAPPRLITHEKLEFATDADEYAANIDRYDF